MSEPTPPANPPSPAFWRSFLLYTGSRVGMFAVTVGLLYGVGVRGIIVVFAALVLSGIASYFLLDRQRATFAAALEARMQRRQASPRVGRRRAAAAARAAREDAIAHEMIAAQQLERLSSGDRHDP